MALVEFECPDCGTRFEELIRRDSDKDEAKCPKCGQTEVVVLFSPAVAHGLSTPGRGKQVPRTEDPGFIREWDSIWADDPTATQRSSNEED